MQPGESLIDPARTHHAVLSQGLPEHRHHLSPTDPTSLDEAGHHLDIRKDRRRPGDGGRRERARRRTDRNGGLAALGVLRPLLLPPRFVAVVRDTTLGGRSLALGLPAPEGAAQVPAPRVARVREKENPAVPTAGQAPAQPRPDADNRSQQRVIREHQGDDRIAAIPIFDEPKIRRNLDCQKPRFWLWTPTKFKRPLSYGNSLRLSR